VFDENVRPTVHKAHNVWYDYIYLANFGQAARDYQWTIEDDLRQLEKFPDGPKLRIIPPMPECELDPIGEILKQLSEALGLEEVLDFKSNCAEGRQIENRCPTDYVWQRNSWEISCGGSDNLRQTYAGIDYITPYWIGRYYGFVPPGNPNADDDDDDDMAPDDDDIPERDGDDEGGSGGYDSSDDDDDKACCGG
ncbi:MAG: hypothetical protein P9M14_05600, partial [Candidatus Alcyoniella australis]|nr:hypothetical protein [Candidatus Alcyoniella australis]